MRYANHWLGENPGGLRSILSGTVSAILPNPAAVYTSNVRDSSTKERSRGMEGLSPRNLVSFSASPMERKVRVTPAALSLGICSAHALA